MRQSQEQCNETCFRVLFAISVAVACAGGISLWSDNTWFESGRLFQQWGLRWNASATNPLPMWVKVAWPVAVLLAPLAYREGMIGLGLYAFVSLSVQGSEQAARCLYLDGILHWTLGLVAVSFFMGEWCRKSSLPVRRDDILLITLTLLVAWIGVCWLVKRFTGDVAEPLFYRQPNLWIHCWTIFWIAKEVLNDEKKRLSLIAVVAWCVAWRILLTPDSIWLEGHVASVLIMLLPWTLFAIARNASEIRSLTLAGVGLLCAMVLWYVGDGSSYLLHWTAEKINAVTILILLAVVFGLLWIMPSRWLGTTVFGLTSTAVVGTTMMIQNRAAVLAMIVILVSALLFASLRWYWRVGLTAIVGVAIWAGTHYEPLVQRFQASLTKGDSSQERLLLWRIAWDSSKKHPWFGCGPGQFPSIVKTYDPSLSSRLDAHHSWLEMLAETGWPGVVLFTVFWGQVAFLGLSRVGNQIPGSIRWVSAATIGFVAGYVVIGLFGSRHNLPLAYMLAAIPASIHFRAASSQQEK